MKTALRLCALRAWASGLALLLAATGSWALTDNAAFVSQVAVPTATVPGQVYAVSVTMHNTGQTTWTSGASYRLGAVGGPNVTTWGPSRVDLPNSVAPGESVTFSFNATAPAEYGGYNFKWKMVRDDTGSWFGAQSDFVYVQNGVNNAEFVSHTMPASTTPGGSTYAVTVTMKNTGNTTWTSGTGYRLGALEPVYWGITEVALPGDVAPGQNATFSFNVTSPEAWGTYPIRYLMRKGSPWGWFGAGTTGQIVNGVNQSQFVSQSVPSTMSAGQSYAVSITMKNTSGTTWTAANTYGLGAVVPWGTNPWGITRVATPNSVAPDQNVTFSFNVTAPAIPGTHDFKWKMLRDEIGNWFGAISTNVAVNVQAANSLYFIHPDHLNTPRLVADSTGTTVWRWDQQEPSGNNLANDNPSGLGVFSFPLRFEGTYADAETGILQNWHRELDSSRGQYLQSDPLGLRAGLNTYAHVLSSPLAYTDAQGLLVQLLCRPVKALPVKSHCFVWVTCPAEGWDFTLSLFGNPPWVNSTGHKRISTSRDPTNEDNPNSPSVNYRQTITPSAGSACTNDCAFEKSILNRFDQAPSQAPYGGFTNNSNTFAQGLITSGAFGTSLPSNVPPSAPGFVPMVGGRIR